MIRPRFKRNERIHEIALRSDWTFSAKLALVGFVLLVWLIPMLLVGKPELEALARTTHFLGWVFTVGFLGIGVYRFFVQRREARNSKVSDDDSEGGAP